MRFISCASYYGTGSSAVTDFVSEFDSVYSFTDEEFRFLQDPDGVASLEWNLVHHFDRHTSGHAIKRYQHLVKLYCGNVFGRKYEGFFHGNWKKCSDEYIAELTDFTFHGWWNWDLYDRGSFFVFRKRIVNKLLHMTLWRNQPERCLNTMAGEITYCSHPTEEKFLEATRRYIRNLFSSVCGDAQTVMVDQIVSPTNLSTYLRYFDDIKVAVVDRDPRDIFVLEKYVWKDGIIPTDVETFCKWFRYTRSHRETDDLNTKSVRFVQFEDMVYRYDQTAEALADWLGLRPEDHKSPRSRFDPARSVNNTQTWKKVPCDQEEIAYIRRELKEYLYDFDGAEKEFRPEEKESRRG